jgi:hypothetical protein
MAKTTLKFEDSVALAAQLKAKIAKREFAPIYLLMGEESYFIDALCDQLAQTILTPAEQAFNQITIYGKDASELPFEAEDKCEIGGAVRLSVKNTSDATRLICKYPEVFCDYEITKGKMDDVFLAATGKKLPEGGSEK